MSLPLSTQAGGLVVGGMVGSWLASASRATRTRTHSLADQTERFKRAKAEGNARFLDISTVYDGAPLRGKRVLVTGGNKGLGLALTRELSSQGADVVVVVRKICKELQGLEGVAVVQGVDVQSDEQVTGMAEALAAEGGGAFDIVVNNAGYFWEQEETLSNLSPAEQLKQIDVCAVGPMRVTAALLKHGLVKKATGKVVIISSQAGSVEWRRTQNKDKGHDYGHHMSRAACNIAAVLLSEELRADGVAVLLLHPGFSRTGMTAKYSHIWDEEGAVEAEVSAKRVLHEVMQGDIGTSGKFVNCEDGLQIPW